MLFLRNVLISVLLLSWGCIPRTTTTVDSQSEEATEGNGEVAVKVDGPLQVIVLDDEELSRVLEREWMAYSEYEVAVESTTEAEFLARVGNDVDAIQADVILGPSRMLGVLAERRLLRPLPPSLTATHTADAEEGYNMADVWKAVARTELRWDRRSLAVSLGSPVPLLLVRGDLVDSVPQTWSKLDVWVREQRDKLPAGVRPLAEPVQDDWAARMLLSRSAAYLYEPSRISDFFDYSNMQPRITVEPCQRALREMIESHDSHNEGLDVGQTYEAFLSGQAAIAITWPHRGMHEQLLEPPPFPVSIHELPGSDVEYNPRAGAWQPLSDNAELRRIAVLGHAGRVGVICRKGKNASLAGVFLGWVSSAEQGVRLCARSRSSAPFRESQKSQAKAWCDDRLTPSAVAEYGECLDATLSRREVFASIRIPGQARYMGALNDCVLAALRGELAADEALQRASDAWNEITDELGRDDQIAAYRHSLGLDTE